jgi:NAD(P)-dependent dehydrogenase (short-subunit alcohol dehydrogenase family)
MTSKQNILITGCSTGLGRSMAENLARQGHNVFASMRSVSTKNAQSAESLRALASTEGLSLRVIEMDVTREDSVSSAVRQVLSEAGHIDTLINNAGVMTIGISEAISVDQYRTMFEVHVLGAFRVAQAVLPGMRKRGEGLLVYISSSGATFKYPFMGLYGSVKAALESMAEVMNYELFSLGIDTVIMQAGMFATHVGENAKRAENDGVWQEYGLAGQIASGFAGGFAPMVSTGGDPKLLAEAVAQQINLPSSQRSLRIPIGPFSEGLVALNPTLANFQGAVLPALGMGALLERPKK